MVRGPSVLVLVLLAGCAVRTAPPAPIELHTHAGAPVLSEPVPVVHPDRVTVAPADTLYGLSRRYGLPIRAIIDANNLQPPFRLVAGSSLALPQVRTHLVQPGDTLMSVARVSGVDISTLAATNHLAAPFVIRTGETLVMPAPVEAAAAPAPPPGRAGPPPQVASEPLAPPPEPVAQPRPAPVPEAQPALRPPAEPAVTAPPPPQAKPATPPAIAAAGPASAAPPEPKPPQPQGKPAPPPAIATAEPPPAPAAAPAPEPPEREASLPPAPPAPVVPAPPGTAATFIWPVRGRLLASFGTTAQGTHNDGIDIAAPAGTPVLAAAAGEVAYAGNELKGYGNLILVKHESGFVTAYAHNEALLVKRGDRVARGQEIAKVGATGAVDQPQLHFEIRRGTRAFDPSEYLPAQAATASR